MTVRRWLVFGVALVALLSGGMTPTVSRAAGTSGPHPGIGSQPAIQQGRHLTMAQLPAGLARVWRQTVLRDHLTGSSPGHTGAARLAAPALSSFASTFAASGPALRPLAGAAGWTFSMTLTGYGRSTLHPVQRARRTSHAGLTTYRHGRLLEWYRTTASGLEQGFTLPAAPAHAGHGPVVLSLHIGGNLHAAPAGNEVVLASRTGAAVLHYGGLRATDVRGRTLPAHLAVIGDSVRLVLNDRGAQYPLHIDPYLQAQKLVASDAAAGDEFGLSVALSDDGNTTLIGAGNKTVNGRTQAGAAYVFVRPSGGTTWSQQQELTLPDAASNDGFGRSVALSGDGNTVLIGAYNKTVNGQQSAGAAYVFVRPSGGTTWTQQQELTASDSASNDQFGISVALSGDGNTALSGGAGAAYVFVRPSGGSAWTQQQKLTATDAARYDGFGSSVALSGDGNTALIVASNKTVNGQGYAGAAYVFVRPSGGTTWTQQQELTASDAAGDDYFGNSVALSGDGNTVLIGASNKTVNGQGYAGAAYVFVRPSGGTTWSQQQELTASDTASNGQFGRSVALSGDGNTALIGAPYKTVNGVDSAGAAYVFVRPSGGSAWTQQQKLTATDAARYDSFGTSVALSGEGNTALIGASGYGGDATYTETLTGTRAALSGRPTGCANGSTSSVTVALTPTAGATGSA